jgi:predicted ATP-dependent endonuclease of OLD family
MEKLIVKNFGPIKEAEIDLTKFVVFIGDTSTGKSVLGKLISIFRDVNFFNKVEIEDFKKALINFNIDFSFADSRIEYSWKDINIKIKASNIYKYENSILFQKKIEKNVPEFTLMYETFNNAINNKNIDINVKDQILNTLEQGTLVMNSLYTKETIYFPAERILNSIIGNSISGLWANNVALPNYFKNFAAKYEVARKEIKNSNYQKFGFEYSFENGEDKVQFENNKLSLSQASSGIQSLIPLLVLFDYSLLPSEFRLDKSFLIEEPELNLYPIKQKYLIEYIVEKLKITDDKLIITTHSPYILSALDTLMLAKNTFNENPELKKEISEIVSEDKWLDYNDISVYEVRNDGKVYSIKNEEFKSIDTNAIDSVSDIIMEEFERLTELRYAVQ